MKNNIKKLASEAGFILWGDEPWESGQIIDWGTQYDEELIKFAQLVAKDCINSCKKIEDDITQEKFEWTLLGAVEEIQYLISKEYNIEESITLTLTEKDKKQSLLKRIRRNMVASCKCGTKTPDVEYHDDDCLYRVLVESHDLIENI